jgi:hypothetical protein
MPCNARSVSFVVLCLIFNYFLLVIYNLYCWMFIPTGPVGFRGSNGDGARFPPIVLSGPGRGSAIGAWGGDGERPPPRPAPLPSLGGIGGRDCEAQRERIRFDRG